MSFRPRPKAAWRNLPRKASTLHGMTAFRGCLRMEELGTCSEGDLSTTLEMTVFFECLRLAGASTPKCHFERSREISLGTRFHTFQPQAAWLSVILSRVAGSDTKEIPTVSPYVICYPKQALDRSSSTSLRSLGMTPRLCFLRFE